MKFTQNEIIIDKKLFFKFLNLFTSIFLFVVSTILLNKIDLNGFRKLTLLDFIDVIALSTVIIFSLYRAINLFLKLIPFKSFILISSIVSMVLLILRLNTMLTFCTVINFRLVLLSMLTVFRNLIVFILSIYVFKRHIEFKVKQNI